MAGAAGALSFVTGGALASAAGGGGRGRPALALGVYFGGAGFGMVVSAFAVPALIATSGWRSGLARAGSALAAGRGGDAAGSGSCTDDGGACVVIAAGRQSAARATRGMRAVLISYVLFGAGYIAYTTFIVAYLRRSLDYDGHRHHAVLGLSPALPRPAPASRGGPRCHACAADAAWPRRMRW